MIQFFYKVPLSVIMNRMNVFLNPSYWIKTVGFRLRDHMDLVEGTQNLMKFKKGETKNEVTRKLNSMDGIEACSCEGLIPPKQWDFFSKRP